MTRPLVGVIDYHAGNIRSVTNALEYSSAQTRQVRSLSDLAGCTHAVLPGVGAFGFCMEKLRASGLIPAMEQWALHDCKPLLAICVGMQLMADFSDEQGRHAGLGWIGGSVLRIEKTVPEIRVPHVGWDDVVFRKSFGEFAQGASADFYFDHSYAYHAPSHGEELGVCSHGVEFSAVLRRENIVGVQFHPEKSQRTGLRFLRGFLSM